MTNGIVTLKKGEERRLLAGHSWVFSNEILSKSENIENGELINVRSFNGDLLGAGFYNDSSLIAVRLISKTPIVSLEQFFSEKITQADRFRKQLFPFRAAYRMIFSESDGLPGLIIDRYQKTYVLQVNSAGMEKNIPLIVDVLISHLGAQNIFTHHDEYLRRLEGLPTDDQIYYGKYQNEIISDGEVKYTIDFQRGQKTGFYFDQVNNRKYIRNLAPGKKILDAFCNSGGFGLHALQAGAEKVVFIDSSQTEIDQVKINLQLNDLIATERYELICAKVNDCLLQFHEVDRKFEIINLDPPSFTRNKKGIPIALKGYEKLHRLALPLISEGGFLLTSSCSHHISSDDFLASVQNAARKCGRQIQLIHSASTSEDHPILPSMPETRYLNFMVFHTAF
jgi:23S rRNA (cytosine1962-C5)-methyltransferase